MASPQIEKSRLRDLILAFYTKNDPMRLQDGIDINGMVNWTMEKGIGALNNMLQKSYGEVIDPNDNVDMNNAEHINRVSMAVSGRHVLDMHEMKKIKIAEELKRFYKKYDPSKLPAIFKLTEYALYKGENALNSKLRMKYGADLRTFDQEIDDNSSASTIDIDIIPPIVATVNNIPKAAIEGESEEPVTENTLEATTDEPEEEVVNESEVEEVPVVPVIPDIAQIPAEAMASQRSIASSAIVEITRPPSILEDEVQQILETEEEGNQVTPTVEEVEIPPEPEEGPGIVDNLEEDKEKLQAELLRFYKTHDPDKLIVLDALVLWALQLGRKGYNEKMMQLYGADLDTPIEGEEQQPAPVEPASQVARARINKPIKTKQNLIQRIVGVQKPSFVSFENAAKQSATKADPLKGPNLFREFMKGEGEPCGNYRLDMTSPLFGICVCGHTKKACMSA